MNIMSTVQVTFLHYKHSHCCVQKRKA